MWCARLSLSAQMYQVWARKRILRWYSVLVGSVACMIAILCEKDDSKLMIDLEKINGAGNRATFIDKSSLGKTSTKSPSTNRESRIDKLFLDVSTPEHTYCLETYPSQGDVSETALQQLRCYFVAKCNFPVRLPPSMSTDGCVLARCSPASRVLIALLCMECA